MSDNSAAPMLITGRTASYLFVSTTLREQINLMDTSRDKSLALTKLDELDFWATRAAAIINPPVPVQPQ